MMSRRGQSSRLAALAWCALALSCGKEPPIPAPGGSSPGAPVQASSADEDQRTSSDRKAAEKQTLTADADVPPVRKDGTIFGETELMGTRVSINVWLDPDHTPEQAGDAMRAALLEMARLEDMMSEWRSESELSRLNAAAGGRALRVSPELFEVLARSKQIAEQTAGTFDPTFHGVGKLWSFKPGSKPPARQEIARHVELVDWRKLELDHDHRTARLAKSGMAIGLGAIAKGYIVDRASALLRERGLLHHVVEAGGDTYASGTKGGKPWMVGVQDPDGPGIVGAIPATDEAVVTSGDYQRFFEHDGVRYAHILDPRTGGPLRSKDTPKSVTLLASNAADADAYCTAVAVMGAKKGMAWVETHDGIEAVILPRSGPPMVSAGLAGRFVEQRPRAGGD